MFEAMNYCRAINSVEGNFQVDLKTNLTGLRIKLDVDS